jgi:hypothetical protein
VIKLATGTANCIGHGNRGRFPVATALAFITAPMEVIFSDLKNLGSVPAKVAPK